MLIRKSLVSLAAAGMVLGSTAAAAAPVSDARVGSHTAKSQDLAGISTLGILIALAVVGGVVAIVATDNNDNPVSP